MGKIEDQKIAAKVLAGDKDCFRLLVRRYQQPIAKLVYFNIADANEVEDLTQETFIRAYQYLRSYNPDQSFKNWLFSIAVNLCRRWQRRKILTVPLRTIFHLSSEENTAQSFLENIGLQELKEHLQQLPAKESLVLILHYINDFSIREVAEILQIPEGTAKSRLNRGLARLRRELTDKTIGRDQHGSQLDKTV